MKLKYKKLIIMITFGTMLIGLIVFSIIPSKKDKSPKKETSTEEQVSTQTPAANEPTDEFLKKNAYPEINELVRRYFDAKMTVNMTEMELLVSDTSQVDTKKLQTQLEYIEAIQNIDCYTIDGPQEGTYRVYIYHELKIKNIATLAPALTGLYVTQNSDGSYVIFLSTLDGEAQTFIENSDKSAEAVELTNKVRLKLEEALNSDVQLKEFYNMLEQGSSDDPTPNQTDQQQPE